MSQQQCFIPSRELATQWSGYAAQEEAVIDNWVAIASKAAQWGADQELEACCESIRRIWELERVATVDDMLRELRRDRRPRPLLLKEQALAVLQQLSESGYPANYQPDSTWDTIRRALESLPD